jgi:hypothetical protein
MRFAAVVISCAQRAAQLAQTLASLAASDWEGEVTVVIDDEAETQPLRRIDATWMRALQVASDQRVADFVLMCEDDVLFSRHLEHNLTRWSPLQGRRANDPFWGSLYFPDSPDFLPRLESPPGADHHIIADMSHFWGAQAIVISPAMAGWAINFWPGNAGPHDKILPWLASRMCPQLFLHRPSLVDHVGVSTWGGIPHHARDFDPGWRAGA